MGSHHQHRTCNIPLQIVLFQQTAGCTLTNPRPYHPHPHPTTGPLPEPLTTTAAFFEPAGRQPTPAFDLNSLRPGHTLAGPALLIDAISTVVVEPGWRATITGTHNIRMDAEEPSDPKKKAGAGAAAKAAAAAVAGGKGGQAVAAEAAEAAEAAAAAVECDPVRLAIFSHRFMGIAEQMGRTLQVGGGGGGGG